ncbi:helix-turn-helix domain-containing protein [Variovorax sp. J22R133]|uniref:helix-turn-helix domain-containing protein n=1 Tax=Variovorax brevis TaxID=3053503 RepID=UPI002577B0F3|nr:helix-turn-helix domain-containing protein [Variovorax sp. J22R133]MDM0115432.1 helix-turn-helix domain-containing protein [Variovorax sp. J22R133]
MRFDSRSTSPRQALDYWRGSLSQSWEMQLAEEADADQFHAQVSVWRMSELIVGTATFGPFQKRLRRERNIQSDQLDHYRLLMLREGEFHCDAAGQRVSLAPGRFVITDMARPEESESACSTAVLYIPRDTLDAALPQPMRLHGLSPDNACAHLLSDHLMALLKALPDTAPQELPALSAATVGLVAASLAPTAIDSATTGVAIDSARLRQVRRHIEEHLCEEELAAPQLCKQLRISRSALYRLFEPLGGVSQYIKERRLARVHQLLAQSSERQVITRLAEDHGFKSAAHFSKAFRAQFGYSPREVPRAVELARLPGCGSAEDRFDHWLESLCH